MLSCILLTSLLFYKQLNFWSFFQPTPKFSKPNSLWDVKDTSHPVTAVPQPSLSKDIDSSVIGFSKDNSSNVTIAIKPNSNQKIPMREYKICNGTINIENTLLKTNQTESSQQKKKEDSGGQPFVAPSNCGELSEVELRLIPRFTEEEIRMIPRFQNWSRGEPSKVITF